MKFYGVILIFVLLSSASLVYAEDEVNNNGRMREKEDLDKDKIEVREKLRGGEYEVEIKGQRMNMSRVNESSMQMRLDKINVKTGLNLTLEDVENMSVGEIMRAYMSNGRYAEVKVMPDVASEIALKRLRAKCGENECQLELKEVKKEGTDESEIVYEVETEKESRVLGLFKAKVREKVEVDVETGEVRKIHKPWWAFLANEREYSESEIESYLNSTGKKITLCHKPESEKQTITVSVNALSAHLKHGDNTRACSDGNETNIDELKISLIKPANNSVYNITNISLEFDLEGNASNCYYVLDNGNESEVSCIGNETFETETGNHSIYVRAVSGNESANSKSHNFEVVLN